MKDRLLLLLVLLFKQQQQIFLKARMIDSQIPACYSGNEASIVSSRTVSAIIRPGSPAQAMHVEVHHE